MECVEEIRQQIVGEMKGIVDEVLKLREEAGGEPGVAATNLRRHLDQAANAPPALLTPEVGRVMFVDVVDPDNFVCVAAFCLQAQARNEMAHVVLTGRPCCFRFTRFSPKTMSFKGLNNDEVKVDFRNHIKAQAYELLPENVEREHSRLLLARVAWHMMVILDDAGVDLTGVVFYDGLVASLGAVSHAIHDYEEMFMDDAGNVVSKEAYFDKVHQLFEMSVEERVQARTNACLGRSCPLISLDVLGKALEAPERLQFFVCGPSTPIPILAKMGSINSKPGALMAMGCSWDGSQNLLGENFNSVADWPAFKEAFVDCTAFPNMNKVIVPTEPCKAGTWLKLGPEPVGSSLHMPKLAKLISLWTSLKRDQLQPAFDLAVLVPRSCVPFPLHEVTLSIVHSDATPVKERCALSVVKEDVDEQTWRDAVDGVVADKPRAFVFWKELRGDENCIVPWFEALRKEAARS